LALVIAISVSACGPAKPPLLKTSVTVGDDSNPDMKNRPSPVVVRVFELKSLAGFNSADFFSLYDKESETLGADLIGKEELRLRPGEIASLSHQLKPDTKFVAALAAFRDLERSQWRNAVAVPPKKKQIDMTVAIHGKTVSVTAAP
jgi:type VI secretion system protein VasD